MLQKSPVSWRENSHVTEVANLKEGDHLVMLKRWPV